MLLITNGGERMRITSSGNVGIGTTNPAQKLHVIGNGRFTGGYFDVGHGVSTEEVALSIGNSRTDNGYAYIDLIGDTTYTDYALRIIRGNTGPNAISQINHRGTGDFEIRTADAANITFDTASLERMRIDAGGNVGIGTAGPTYKLSVAGGVVAGGKVTYTKFYSSLDTTGNAVAGLDSSFNGASAVFTFTCFGHTGGYQKIVYSCYNGGGTWNTKKVIDEGTNDFDMEASANGTTITFTFKSTSGTKAYSPKVIVEAAGSAINSTYA
jgi:hypothetical protein